MRTYGTLVTGFFVFGGIVTWSVLARGIFFGLATVMFIACLEDIITGAKA